MKISISLIAISLIAAACVPQRKYLDLEAKYKEATAKQQACDTLMKDVNARNEELKKLSLDQQKEITHLKVDSSELSTILARTKKLYDDLNDTYERLLRNNETESGKMLASLKDLEEKLKAKETELNNKAASLSEKDKKNTELMSDLTRLQADLKQRENKVKELESILNQKDSAVRALKANISNALLGFQGKGLTVEMRNGKVYVSLEESLLFASGSTVVDKKGEEALIELSRAINKQKDINVMVEGHTDDVKITGGPIKDNWDLSVLRATSIVRILTEKGKVDPKRLIASGRGEYTPVDPAKTAEARKKNRRTEIILTPKLDELFQILND